MVTNARDDAANAEQVKAAVEYVKASLNWELTDDEAEQVRSNVERHLKNGAKLRAYALRNADEPDFVFRPYRAEG
jgi:hypothetical protein